MWNWVRAGFRLTSNANLQLSIRDRYQIILQRLYTAKTEFAQEQVLLKYDEARTTSIHEASHAVSNIPEITGQKVAYITIRGGTSGVGETLYGQPMSGGWFDDLSKIRNLARMALTLDFMEFKLIHTATQF